MNISKRQKLILELLEEKNFLTVTAIAEHTYTSPSSIRRDLAKLENLSLLKRTHGGASFIGESAKAPHLNQRMTKNVIGKRKIAKKAANLLADGQTIMLDGSSTAAFLIPYIAKHKDVTVFTNNISTALDAINYGIKTHCIGGKSINCSAVLGGPECYNAICSVKADILFFSTAAISSDAILSDPTEEENYIRTLMIKNARKTVFLCDSEKFGKDSVYKLISLDEIDFAVFEQEYEEIETKCNIIF